MKNGLFDALVVGPLAVRGNGDHAALRLKQTPRALQSFPTNRIEHDIQITGSIFKTIQAVVDHFVCPKLIENRSSERTPCPRRVRLSHEQPANYSGERPKPRLSLPGTR